MSDEVIIDAVDDSIADELIFKIRINKSFKLYEVFDEALRKEVMDAIIDRNKVKYLEALTKLVAAMEIKNV